VSCQFTGLVIPMLNLRDTKLKLQRKAPKCKRCGRYYKMKIASDDRFSVGGVFAIKLKAVCSRCGEYNL